MDTHYLSPGFGNIQVPVNVAPAPTETKTVLTRFKERIAERERGGRSITMPIQPTQVAPAAPGAMLQAPRSEWQGIVAFGREHPIKTTMAAIVLVAAIKSLTKS